MALAGEEVVIARAGRPRVRLVVVTQDERPRDLECGYWRGRVRIAAGDDRLGPRAKDAIADGRTVVFVSAASAWELALEARLGTWEVPDDLPAMLQHERCTPLDVTTDRGLVVRDLPDLRRDPFDRMLVAQARCVRVWRREGRGRSLPQTGGCHATLRG